jgi:sec-independent protein translocase protein TatA
MSTAFTTWALFGGSLGSGEILLVLVVGLLLFGSKKLPEIARSLGRALEEFRRSAREIRDEIMNAAETPPPRRPKPDQRHDDERPAE